MKALSRYWFAAAPAERLAAVRIGVGAFATLYLLARAPYLSDYSRLSADLFEPIGLVTLIDSPLPTWATWSATATAVALGALFTLGLGFRVVAPAFAVLLCWVLSYRSSWHMIFHTENLLVLQVAVLALSPAADAWSLASRSSPRPPPSGRYGWPLRLMSAVVVATYLLAGIAKLRWGGVGWLDGEVLRNLVATDTARKLLLGSMYSPVAAWMVNLEGAFAALAVVTIVLELGAPLALLGGRVAVIWVVAVMAFHWGVLLIMMIAFPVAMSGIAFLAFAPVERLPGWPPLARRLRRWSPRLAAKLAV